MAKCIFKSNRASSYASFQLFSLIQMVDAIDCMCVSVVSDIRNFHVKRNVSLYCRTDAICLLPWMLVCSRCCFSWLSLIVAGAGAAGAATAVARLLSMVVRR